MISKLYFYLWENKIISNFVSYINLFFSEAKSSSFNNSRLLAIFQFNSQIKNVKYYSIRMLCQQNRSYESFQVSAQKSWKISFCHAPFAADRPKIYFNVIVNPIWSLFSLRKSGSINILEKMKENMKTGNWIFTNHTSTKQ